MQDRVAIFTGGASGVGAGRAKLFAGEGARIVLVNPAGIEQIGREIKGDVHRFVADVTGADAVQDIVKKTLDEWARIGILMACAGTSAVGTAATIAEEYFARITRWVAMATLPGLP